MNASNNDWLIADIGGTSTRCAIVSGGSMSTPAIYRNENAATLQDLLSLYMQEADSRPGSCALAIAAPISGDAVQMTNRDWRFNKADIRKLGFRRVEIINDFHAIAYALPRIDDRSRIEIGKASQYRDGNLAVLGPGSGLGMAAWMAAGAPMCGEGGHITIAGRNEQEDAIIAKLRKRYGHCSAERILSGPGLAALHQAMHGAGTITSEEITSNPDSPANAETLQQFFRFLGNTAADLALITGALGGVYIAGGIVPACIPQIIASDFRSRFEDKNRYSGYLRAIPTWVITDPVPGLTGLAALVAQGS